MAIVQNQAITSQSSAQINVPRWSLEAKIYEDDGTTLVSDFTDGNALEFHQAFASLSTEQQRALLDDEGWGLAIMKKKAGV